MGSAEGRRKCCMYFWQRGYHAGFTGIARGNRVDEMPSAATIGFFANTGSPSFKGLWRMGFRMGLNDRHANHKSREFTGYEQRHEYQSK